MVEAQCQARRAVRHGTRAVASARAAGPQLLAVVLAVLMLCLSPSAVWAQAPEAAVADPAPTIASKTEVTADSDIAHRITGIFEQIEGLDQVSVSVSEGVVTLEGSVAQQAQADRAEAIASRVAGVVTVQNKIVRDVAVETNVVPVLDKLRADVRSWVNAVPLLLTALAGGLGIALFGFWLANRSALWKRVTDNVFLADLISSSIRIVFSIGGALFALQILDASALVGAILGGAGVAGIALGFAMRDTVDNYVSSVMLSLRQPFRANDHVVIDDKEGRVIRLTSRATILMTMDGNHLRIPNSTVFKSVILNYTRNPQRRFQFDLGVDADDDAMNAIRQGVESLRGLAFVLATPEPSGTIENVGDSNIILRFFGWVDQRKTDFNKGRSLAIQAVKTALETSGFSLPEPIYRLRFEPGAAPGASPATSRPSKPQRKRPAPAPPKDEVDDTSPEPAVEQMVHDERESSNEPDLLRHDTPME